MEEEEEGCGSVRGGRGGREVWELGGDSSADIGAAARGSEGAQQLSSQWGTIVSSDFITERGRWMDVGLEQCSSYTVKA